MRKKYRPKVSEMKRLHILMSDNHIISVRNIRPDGYPSVSARTKRHPTIKAQRPGKDKRARTTEDERQFVLDAILANNQHRLRPTIVTVHQCCRLRWHLRKSSCSNWLRDVINSNDKVVTLLFASAPS